jgi:conjugative relaxase-like TrwC/TraI family protein
VGTVMTVHKLTAGDGYAYLTRQVASADERRAAGQSLAEYYTAAGNPPGVWLGGGAVTLGVAGGVVSEAQMRALFGDGAHPNRDVMLAAGAPVSATRLGAPYLVTDPGRRRPVAGYDLVFTPVKSASVLWALGGAEVRVEVEAAHHDAVANTMRWVEEHAALTRVGHAGVAQVDTTGLVAAAFDHRESRAGDPDLHTHVAVANKVCGVDGQWRAVDARVLHALGVAASERYNTRFEDAMARRLGVEFAERRDRPGGGPGKRPVREIVGIPGELVDLFSKRRAVITDRYTELLDDYHAAHGRSASRVVQLRLAQQATLETREGKGPGRPLAEMVADWTAQATAALGRETVTALPARVTGPAMAPAVGRTNESAGPGVEGGRVVDEPAAPAGTAGGRVPGLSPERVVEVAGRVVDTVSEQRATWTRWNVHAEAERALRSVRFTSPEGREAAVRAVVAAAIGPGLSVRIGEPVLVAEPEGLRRRDGESVYAVHGGDRYTTARVLAAEDALVAAALTGTQATPQSTPQSTPQATPRTTPQASFGAGGVVDPLVADAALGLHQATTGVVLDDGQRRLVSFFACYPAVLAVGIGPAGTGKTTAMRAFAAVLAADGRRLVPLATSAKAAQVLGEELGVRAENLHKFLHHQPTPTRHSSSTASTASSASSTSGTGGTGGTGDTAPAGAKGLGWFGLERGDVVLVDEAGMAGTLQLADLVAVARAAGAVVRLLGDPAQLAAVDAGGALQLLEAEVGAARLEELHRFDDPAEAAATLALRDGDPAGLGFYAEHRRIRAGDRDVMLAAAYDGWAADTTAGLTSVLVATSNADVAGLNTRARAHRVSHGVVEPDGVPLGDGTAAGVGDLVVTRANARTLTCRRGRDWVKNGDSWQVTGRYPDGSLTVRHAEHAGTVRLPAGYVADSVQLGYATTAHRAQGATVDTAHALVTAEMTREALYVASTRARTQTTWYTATHTVLDLGAGHQPPAPTPGPVELLTGVLARTGAETSATGTIRATQAAATELPGLVARYSHARDHAAGTALADHAQAALPAALAARVLADPSARQLAQVLADAAARGADPVRVLATAATLEQLTDTNPSPPGHPAPDQFQPETQEPDGVDGGPAVVGVAWPARALAGRIRDYPRLLGIPLHEPTGPDGRPARPLPWLDPPRVGHPGWDDYLTTRAELIADRAARLGSVAEAYREAYRLTHLPPGDLGELPPEHTTRRDAYHAAHRDQAHRAAAQPTGQATPDADAGADPTTQPAADHPAHHAPCGSHRPHHAHRDPAGPPRRRPAARGPQPSRRSPSRGTGPGAPPP